MNPRRYAVIGQPVSHSRSPWLHAYFARVTQRPIVYAAIQSSLDDFHRCVDYFFHTGGVGLNVTVPFKAVALCHAADVSVFAQQAGSANVLMRRGTTIHAYNTDGSGFLRDLSDYLPAGIAGQTVLLLGAGGAARAVACAIASQKPAALWIVNRTLARAAALAAKTQAVAMTHFPEGADIIINATSAGLADNPVHYPPSMFAGVKVVYDLSYGAAARTFLEQASDNGVARVTDGAGMLVWQAAMSFAIWEGIMPSVSGVIDALRTG